MGESTANSNTKKQSSSENESSLDNRAEVQLEHRHIAFSNIRDYLEWDADGNVRMYPSEQLSTGQLAAVKKIKTKKTVQREKDGTQIECITFEFELHDKVAALQRLDRHLPVAPF